MMGDAAMIFPDAAAKDFASCYTEMHVRAEAGGKSGPKVFRGTPEKKILGVLGNTLDVPGADGRRKFSRPGTVDPAFLFCYFKLPRTPTASFAPSVSIDMRLSPWEKFGHPVKMSKSFSLLIQSGRGIKIQIFAFREAKRVTFHEIKP